MSIYTLQQRKYIALTMIILLGLFIGYSLLYIISGILGAVVIHTLFFPMFMWLTEKKGMHRIPAASIIILVSFLIIILPFVTLFWMLYQKIIYFKEHPSDIYSIVNGIDRFLANNFGQENVINRFLSSISEYAVGYVSTAMDTLLTILLLIAILYFLLYFMLVKYEVLERVLLKYLPFREKNLRHFAKELKNVTFSNVVGQGIIAFSQGFLLTVGFLIFGLDDPFFWGIICFFLSFLPVIGSPVVFVPAGIFAITQGDTFAGIGIIIWGSVLVMNIDNVLRLIINKKLGNIHPLITIIGVVIGIPIFGVLGLVYGPLILAFFVLLVRIYESGFAEPEHTEKEKVVPESEISPPEEE